MMIKFYNEMKIKLYIQPHLIQRYLFIYCDTAKIKYKYKLLLLLFS